MLDPNVKSHKVIIPKSNDKSSVGTDHEAQRIKRAKLIRRRIFNNTVITKG